MDTQISIPDLIKQHDERTRRCSVEHHMKSLSPTYEQIISFGEDAVPHILFYLKNNRGGMNVMMLLTDILEFSPYTHEKITDDKGEEIKGFVAFSVAEYKQAWIEWGEKTKFI